VELGVVRRITRGMWAVDLIGPAAVLMLTGETAVELDRGRREPWEDWGANFPATNFVHQPLAVLPPRYRRMVLCCSPAAASKCFAKSIARFRSFL
jgi:hypothetical protein